MCDFDHLESRLRVWHCCLVSEICEGVPPRGVGGGQTGGAGGVDRYY